MCYIQIFGSSIQRHKFLSSSPYENYETMWHISRSFISYHLIFWIQSCHKFPILVKRASQKEILQQQIGSATSSRCKAFCCYRLKSIWLDHQIYSICWKVKGKSCWKFHMKLDIYCRSVMLNLCAAVH
jgi:hypothetical protein